MKPATPHFCILTAILVFTLVGTIQSAKPALAVTVPQNNKTQLFSFPVIQNFDADKCRSLLQRTADRLGWVDPEMYVNEYDDGSVSCQMTSIDRSGSPVAYDVFITNTHAAKSWCDDCDYYCNTPGNENDCICIDVHGFTARQTEMINNSGTSLEFCDESCNLVFKMMTRTDDGHFVDPKLLADALYYSALEMNCCQVIEEAPPAEIQPGPEPALPPEEVPAPPDEIADTPFDEPDTLARNPLVPFAGALLGTLFGWLISIAAINWTSIQNFFTSSVPTSTSTASPSAQTPFVTTWEEWERKYTPGEPPKPLSEPSLKELHSVDISVEDSKAEVLRFYSNDILPENRTHLEKVIMHKLDTPDFLEKYLKIFGKDKDIDLASAFFDPGSGEITICQPRAVNYTPIHELVHVTSNPTFGSATNKTFDEAVTEYFTLKIAKDNHVPRLTEYQLNGSTAIVDEIVARHGEEILRKAYFQTGKHGVAELRSVVDQRLGPGAFDRVLDIMSRVKTEEQLLKDPTNEKQKALDLLRGRGIRMSKS
jgi:hypothetical protein